MTNAQYIEDLKVMIEADAKHLAQALATGHRVQAHGFVDSIIDNSRILEDLQIEAQKRASQGLAPN
jgi:hypothetical protein